MVVIAGLATATQAQVRPHALGLRIGSGSSEGIELSYQHGLNSKNRLEFDAGAYNDNIYKRLGLVGIYQWDWNLTGGLNWYIGPAIGVSLDKYENKDGFIGVGVGGQLGLEYDLNKMKLPLLISLDARPMYDFISDYKGTNWTLALGVRYTWGKAYASKKK